MAFKGVYNLATYIVFHFWNKVKREAQTICFNCLNKYY
jgi:hypothetical protein